MLNSLTFFHARQLAALVAASLLAGCGCGNCTAPAFQTAQVSGPPPTLAPGSPPTLPPGATPVPVLPPGATPPPAALTCAQNAVPPNKGVPLGSDFSYGVLGGQTVTNSGLTVVNGNLGLYPGVSVTGFTGTGTGGPGIVNGVIHVADSVALTAQSDLTTAYGNAAGRAISGHLATADIGGTTIPPGVWTPPVSSPSLAITGTVTLDGQNDPNSVFIFQIPTTLTTATNSAVVLINAAQACNVFWAVGSSATLTTGSIFNGTIITVASISLQAGAIVHGRLLAPNAGSVTLLTNTITVPGP